MHRNTFIRFWLTIGAYIATPFHMHAKAKEGKRIEKGFMVDAGRDRLGNTITPFDGDSFFTKVSSKDTDGDLYVFVSTRIKEGGRRKIYLQPVSFFPTGREAEKLLY